METKEKEELELIEFDFSSEAFQACGENCKVKINMESGYSRCCKKLNHNRDAATCKEYPWAILVATSDKNAEDKMVWRKYSISPDGRVFSSAKEEPGYYKWEEDHGRASILLPRDKAINYLNSI